MSKKAVFTKDAPAAIGPYSQAVITGDFVYCSGQLGIDPNTGELEEGLENQTRRAFKNVEAVLNEAGCKLDDIVKATVFMKNMDDFARVNEIYSEHFTEPYPARSAVEVARLPKDALIEIEVIARKGQRQLGERVECKAFEMVESLSRCNPENVNENSILGVFNAVIYLSLFI